jgi:hypothetical protein
MFVVHVGDKGYVEKRGGMVLFHDNPRDASRYPTKDTAEAGKIGHHRDMGGNGFKGQIVSYYAAVAAYDRQCTVRQLTHW